MGNEKSRFLKRDDGTIYDSLTSITWMANDSRLDMDKEVSYAETEEESYKGVRQHAMPFLPPW